MCRAALISGKVMVTRCGGGFGPIDGEHVARGFVERGRAGKKRGGVAVFAEAEQEQIVDVARFAEARGDGGELALRIRRGGVGIDLAADAEDVSLRECRRDRCSDSRAMRKLRCPHDPAERSVRRRR